MAAITSSFMGAALKVAAPKATRASRAQPVRAEIYPEFGTYPGGGESPVAPFTEEKNAERELIHGRFGMLAVTGAYSAEVGTGVPWFKAGEICTPDDCTGILFPGAEGGLGPLAPEGSGFPTFTNVLAFEVITMGLAEAYRTGLTEPAFDELTVGDASPGGRFDPLSLGESGDLEELKIKELKHARLAMFAWNGCIAQACVTKEGPVANVIAHRADPTHVNLMGAGFFA